MAGRAAGQGGGSSYLAIEPLLVANLSVGPTSRFSWKGRLLKTVKNLHDEGSDGLEHIGEF